jgi:hypothetical protein
MYCTHHLGMYALFSLSDSLLLHTHYAFENKHFILLFSFSHCVSLCHYYTQ